MILTNSSVQEHRWPTHVIELFIADLDLFDPDNVEALAERLHGLQQGPSLALSELAQAKIDIAGDMCMSWCERLVFGAGITFG